MKWLLEINIEAEVKSEEEAWQLGRDIVEHLTNDRDTTAFLSYVSSLEENEAKRAVKFR